MAVSIVNTLWKYIIAVVFISVLTPTDCLLHSRGLDRTNCNHKTTDHSMELRRRLDAIKEQMRMRISLQGHQIDGYIVPPFDEHQNREVDNHDRRVQYLTGFSGPYGYAAVTLRKAAFWVENQYLHLANTDLICEWELYEFGDHYNITEWFMLHLPPDTHVGTDPHLIPHFMWSDWEGHLSQKFIQLMRINRNLIDLVWGKDRPYPYGYQLRVQPQKFAGEKWESKIETLRNILKAQNIDAMVITSLAETAYMLNLRGSDIPHLPVFKAYLVVTPSEIILHTNETRITDGLTLHLKSHKCFNPNCVKVQSYEKIWSLLRTYAQVWRRILVPARCVFDLGASEAIHMNIPVVNIVEMISPIIFMKAQKNFVERAGMKTAHIRDAAAICEVMSYLEERLSLGKIWTETDIQREVDRSRRAQQFSHGVSFETVVAFGAHGASPKHVTSNLTNAVITDKSTLIIESGGQYSDGTTDVARTYHFGEPTQEQKTAYTNVLAGIIRLSMLKFPQDLKPSEIDSLSRSTVWGSMSDYPHGTGHGIGSHLSVHESPIQVSYNVKEEFTFKEGYFFSNEPAYYKEGDFGIRLENVLEVIDTGRIHPSGAKFLALQKITLVPYEPKLIDRALLSPQERRLLNEYNIRIRDLVGLELKKQKNLKAFYWMMNKTRHIKEYLPENEYRKGGSSTTYLVFSSYIHVLSTIIFLHLLRIF